MWYNYPMIKAILFDFGGVLIEDPTKEIFKKYFENLNEESKKLFWKNAIDYANGELKSETLFYKNIVKIGKLNEDWRIIRDNYFRSKKLNFKLLDFIYDLKKIYKIGLVTDNGTENIEYWGRRIEFKKYFDVVVVSAAIGHKKPHPKIYMEACKNLKVDPQECLFIDDSDEPLQGAKQLGMDTFKFEIDETEYFINYFYTHKQANKRK